MRNLFKDLQDTEIEALRERRAGEISPKVISRLRKLANRCRKDPEAGSAICYHGSLALLHEFDQDWRSAAEHRRTEIYLIEQLHKLMVLEPPSLRRSATQNYRAVDLKERREILKQLAQKAGAEPASCSEPRGR